MGRVRAPAKGGNQRPPVPVRGVLRRQRGQAEEFKTLEKTPGGGVIEHAPPPACSPAGQALPSPTAQAPIAPPRSIPRVNKTFSPGLGGTWNVFLNVYQETGTNRLPEQLRRRREPEPEFLQEVTPGQLVPGPEARLQTTSPASRSPEKGGQAEGAPRLPDRLGKAGVWQT